MISTCCARCGMAIRAGYTQHATACKRVPLPDDLLAEQQLTGDTMNMLAVKYSAGRDFIVQRLRLAGVEPRGGVRVCTKCGVLLDHPAVTAVGELCKWCYEGR